MSTFDTLRIFVVDDEPVIASTLSLILGAKGFSARSFTDPFEALEAARDDEPDILIADITMPSLTGMDLAVQIRQLWPACRVLLVSGHLTVPDQLVQLRQEGFECELVTKPVHPEVLLAKIDGFVRQGAGRRTKDSE